MDQKAKQEFKYIAIKNWNRYQCKDRHGRNIKLYVKDYCGKDIDDLDYARLTVTQRYYVDALCRLRGRLGKNIPYDIKFIARALAVLPQERHNLSAIVQKLVGCVCADSELPRGSLCAACEQLVGCGCLVLTNQEIGFSDSDSDTNSDSDSDTNSSKGGEPQAGGQVVGGGSAPSPDPIQEPETPASDPERVGTLDPELVALAKKLFTEIGEPSLYANPETAKAWYKLLKAQAGLNSVAYVKTVLDWALASEFWFPKIRKSRKLDPCQYFIEKFLTFVEQMDGEEADARRQKKSAPAGGKEVRPGSYEITSGEIQ